jgi:hypothetical protein
VYASGIAREIQGGTLDLAFATVTTMLSRKVAKNQDAPAGEGHLCAIRFEPASDFAVNAGGDKIAPSKPFSIGAGYEEN